MHTESASSEIVGAINPEEFINTLHPSLIQGCLEEALFRIGKRWTCPQIVELLKNKNADVRKVAALALSAVGDQGAVVPLAIALHDVDPKVREMAEHGLWSVWFRLATPAAVNFAKCGNTHMHHGNYACAIEKFTCAIQEDRNFAEAYNQRAIAHYLSERYEESIADCKASLERMPQHFGAMAGMGHCHAHLGHWREAKRCYRLALAIHPGLEGIQESLDQIGQILQDAPGA